MGWRLWAYHPAVISRVLILVKREVNECLVTWKAPFVCVLRKDFVHPLCACGPESTQPRDGVQRLLSGGAGI